MCHSKFHVTDAKNQVLASLFSRDSLNWSQVTVKNYALLQKISFK